MQYQNNHLDYWQPPAGALYAGRAGTGTTGTAAEPGAQHGDGGGAGTHWQGVAPTG